MRRRPRSRSRPWSRSRSRRASTSYAAEVFGCAAVVERLVLPPSVDGELPEDPDAAQEFAAEHPDLVVVNGVANQYDHAPLTVRVGKRVRVWVLDVGPNRPTSFHVVGGQFDTTYAEGAYLLRRGDGGAQSLGLQPAQGGFVELTFPEPGDYPFVSHLMIDAERGAHGLFRVTPSGH